jgi:hypothetical protein
MFKPTINNKSRQLLSNKNIRKNKKVDNGKTYNLDFYKAVPDFPRALSPKQKTFTHKKGSKKFSRSAKTQVEVKTPKKNPHPTYASPYNKGILSAGIPLKTLIEKGDKHRSKLKRKARKKNETLQYTPGRGISRSKSKTKSGRRVSRSPNTQPFSPYQKDKSRPRHNYGSRTKHRANSRANSRGSRQRSPHAHVEIASRRISSSQYAQDEIFFQSLRSEKSSKGSSRARGDFKF